MILHTLHTHRINTQHQNTRKQINQSHTAAPFSLMEKGRRGGYIHFSPFTISLLTKSNFMNFYLAKIVYQIICGEGKHTPQFDEQLRLITARSYADAFDRATAIGKHDEHSFFNQHQKLVQWKFINVCELFALSDYADGAEIYSAIKERNDAQYYISDVNKKAFRLKQDEQNILMHVS